MGSIVIDASGEYIANTASTVPAFNAVTISGWVKRASGSSLGALRSICGLGLTGGVNQRFLQWFTDDKFYPLGDILGSETTALTEDAWRYVALIGGSTTVTVYSWSVSGSTITLIDSDSGCGPNTGTPTEVCIGSRPVSHDQEFFGKFAYFKVWGAALSQANVEAEILSTTFVRTADAYAGFADSTTDISGNSRTWTFNNTGTDSDTPPVTGGGGSSSIAVLQNYYSRLRA
jgi:hypothetical protein